MREKGLDHDRVRTLLKEARERDLSYPDGVLSSMCTSAAEAAREAHDLFVETNLGDPGLFPGTAELERELIRDLASLTNLEGGDGYVTTGGTESNVQALRIFRNLSETEEPEVVVPRSAHFSFDKAADLLGITLLKADLDERYRVDPESVETLVTEDTIGLVAVAGTTETGQVDPVEEVARIADENSLHLHVDAAFGGFVLPFLDDAPGFDFSIDAVDTLTIDPHKMGLSTIPAGALLVSSPSALDAISTETPYLTSDGQHSLTGTRTGAGAASAYAAAKNLGRQGYREIVSRCVENAGRLADGVREIEGVDLSVEPATTVVSIDCRDPYGLADRLEERGWRLSVSRVPEAIRVVVMPHVTAEVVDRFLEDLEAAL